MAPTDDVPMTPVGQDVRHLIAEGRITRERACDGKIAYRTPEFAEKIAKRHSARFGTEMVHYQCPFCLQYHLATALDP